MAKALELPVVALAIAVASRLAFVFTGGGGAGLAPSPLAPPSEMGVFASARGVLPACTSSGVPPLDCICNLEEIEGYDPTPPPPPPAANGPETGSVTFIGILESWSVAARIESGECESGDVDGDRCDGAL